MEPYRFENLLTQLRQRHFGKLCVLQESPEAQGFYNAGQVRRVLETFRSSKEKPEALCVIKKRIYPMTCYEAAAIMELTPFNDDKLEILTCIARYITDGASPCSQNAIEQQFPTSHYRKKARDVMTEACAVGGYSQHKESKGFFGDLVSGFLEGVSDASRRMSIGYDLINPDGQASEEILKRANISEDRGVN